MLSMTLNIQKFFRDLGCLKSSTMTCPEKTVVLFFIRTVAHHEYFSFISLLVSVYGCIEKSVSYFGTVLI